MGQLAHSLAVACVKQDTVHSRGPDDRVTQRSLDLLSLFSPCTDVSYI